MNHRLLVSMSGALLLLFAGCADTRHRLIVSVPDQKMLVLTDGKPEAIFAVSTSKFGTGDREGSYATPLGHLCVRKKIGDGAALGTVFHSRKPTGEVIPPNAPGRDPIVTRIIWLDGLETHNRNAFGRCIYIHGTPQESMILTHVDSPDQHVTAWLPSACAGLPGKDRPAWSLTPALWSGM